MIRKEGKLVEMHPYRYTPGSASVKSLHRLLLTASLQSGVYECFTVRSRVASKSSLFPKVEKFVNGVFAPPVLDKKFGVPAVPLLRDKSLLDARLRARGRRPGSRRCAPRASPLRQRLRRGGQSRPSGNDPSRRKQVANSLISLCGANSI